MDLKGINDHQMESKYWDQSQDGAQLEVTGYEEGEGVRKDDTAYQYLDLFFKCLNGGNQNKTKKQRYFYNPTKTLPDGTVKKGNEWILRNILISTGNYTIGEDGKQHSAEEINESVLLGKKFIADIVIDDYARASFPIYKVDEKSPKELKESDINPMKFIDNNVKVDDGVLEEHTPF